MRFRYTDTAGKCFADTATGCMAMSAYQQTCGTFACPFYKPEDCEEWIRREDDRGVELISPEDYYSVDKQQGKGREI